MLTPLDLANYTSVSNIPVGGKMLESVVVKQLIQLS